MKTSGREERENQIFSSVNVECPSHLAVNANDQAEWVGLRMDLRQLV